MSSSQLLAFLVASFLFIQLPGPSLLFTIGRALTVGRRDALLSVLGNATGLLAQVAAVAVGLGSLVATSTAAFTTIKLLGAAYVVYLGVQAIRHRADARAALDGMSVATSGGAWASVRTGLFVGLTNPKTIVFFVAFLPQFVAAGDTGGPATPQLLVLGLVFAAMAAGSDSCWAFAASRAREWFAREPRRLDRLGGAGGVMMIGLGAVLATTSNQ